MEGRGQPYTQQPNYGQVTPWQPPQTPAVAEGQEVGAQRAQSPQTHQRPARSGGKISEVRDDVFKAILGEKWASQTPTELDFSSHQFYLESVEASDGSGGIGNTDLDVSKLKSLNLSNNGLFDLSTIFSMPSRFISLERLFVRSNSLTYIGALDLPRLVQLDLSRNALTTIPDFSSCRLPQLEMLNLSNNHMSGSWGPLTSLLRLKSIDLSFNDFDVFPSVLVTSLSVFKAMPLLQQISLKGNPCAKWFPEYIVYAVHALPRVTIIDDQQVTVKGANQSDLLQLENYDSVYSKRRLEAANNPLVRAALKKGVDQMSEVDEVGDQQMPTIRDLNACAERALTQPENVVEHASRVYQYSSIIYSSATSLHRDIFAGCGPRDMWPQLTASYLQAACLLIERHEAARPLLIRALARTSVVSVGLLGTGSLSSMADLMQGGQAAASEIGDAIEEVVVPVLQGRALDDETTIVVLEGLEAIPEETALAESLKACVPQLCRYLSERPWHPSVLRVLSAALCNEANAVEATGQAVPQIVSHILLTTSMPPVDDEVAVDESEAGSREMYSLMVKIASRCAYYSKKAATRFTVDEIHTRVVLPYSRTLLRPLLEKKSAERVSKPLSVPQATFASGLMRLMINMMRQNGTAFIDAMQLHVIDMFLVPAKTHEPDPTMLAAALEGLVVCLSEPHTRHQYLDSVTTDLKSLTPLMEFITGGRYPALYEACARHSEGFATRLQQRTRPVTPPLTECVNVYAHRVFVAIVDFFRFYLSQRDSEFCMGVSIYQRDRGRNDMLFNLVSMVPSNEVRLAAVEAICEIPLTQLVSKDIHSVMKVLDTQSKSTITATTQRLLEALITLLKRVLEDTTLADANKQDLRRDEVSIVEEIKTTLASQCVEVVVEVLLRNSYRRVKEKIEQENRKTSLSICCVEFLRSASRFVSMRIQMRSETIKTNFRKILKNEEELHSPDNRDIPIERCWIGKDLSLLLSCLSGPERLTPSGKVAFRLVSRFADVMEGVSDARSFGQAVLLKNLCDREAKWFNLKAMRNEVKWMDEHDFEDRIKQQQMASNTAAFERLLIFLMRLATSGKGNLPGIPSELDTSEIWAGKLKGVKLTLEKKIDDLENSSDGGDGQKRKNGTGTIFRDEVAEEGELSGRSTLMRHLQGTKRKIDTETAAIYLRSATELYGAGGVWKNVTAGIVNECVIISSFFRVLHNTMVMGVSDDVRRSMIKVCRRPAFIRRTLQLVRSCHLMDYNVGSKWIEVIRLGIAFEPHQPAESMDLIVAYDIVCQTLSVIGPPLLHLLKQAITRPLEMKEQVFCTQFAFLYLTICQQTPYIKFSHHLEVQRMCVEECLHRFVSPTVTKVLVAMIVYDMQLASGSAHGTYISHLHETTAVLRELMREYASSALSCLVQRCETHIRYPVIKAFNSAQVFDKCVIRPSFMFELLEEASCGHFATAIEIGIANRYNRTERLLDLLTCHVYDSQKKKMCFNRIIAISNYAIYLIIKPDSIRVPDGEPRKPHENSIFPKIDRTISFASITRLVRGFPGTQLLHFGIIDGETTKTARMLPTRLGEAWLSLVLDRGKYRRSVLDCVYALSGPNVDGRVDVFSDIVMKECIKQHVEVKRVTAANFVFRGFLKGEPRLVLHLLTLTYFYEFLIDWSVWFSPDPDRLSERETAVLMELEDDEEEEAALAEEADKLMSDDEEEDDEKKEETKKEETEKPEDPPQAKAPGTLRLPQQKGLNNFIGYLVDDEEEEEEGGDSVSGVKLRRENDRTGATDLMGEPSDVAKPHKYIRWDSEGITKQRKAAMKAPGLQHTDEVTAKGEEFLPSWLGKVAGEAPGERFSARLAIALEKLLKLSIKHKVKHINAVEFGASELPRVAYSFKIVESATTTLEEDIDKRESTGGWLLTDILGARSEDRERRKANAKMDYIDVRYLDDSARDWWRRAVAAALNRTEKARTWKRMFQDAPIKDQKK
eukprot:GHVN01089222.1.p1 GENE.GHVN01089222.1~~GHVN01089222.1.p1  ORF type:complete len:1965 (-),score=370.62 GHVN01089222.1:104-5998(-)